MLFENVIKILDKSKKDNVDLIVARGMLASEENIPYEELKPASDFIKAYYDTITKCRRLGDNDTIKALVEAYESNNIEIANSIIEEVKDRAEE